MQKMSQISEQNDGKKFSCSNRAQNRRGSNREHVLIDITVLLLGYIALADCALEGIITKPFNSHTKQPAQAVQTHSS
jgi:hypothetical protein